MAALMVRMDHQDEKLGEIFEHVRETNGRVKKLELWQARVSGATSWVPQVFVGVAVGAIVALIASVL